MTRKEYIAKYKKEGLVLVEHPEQLDKDGDPMRQYLPVGTVSTFAQYGWVTVNDIETPPEVVNTLLTHTESIENEIQNEEQVKTETISPKPKGRPKTN